MALSSDGLFDDMNVLGVIGYVLEQTRFIFLVPILKRLVNLCQVISLLLFIDAAYMAIVVAIVKLLGRTPKKVLKWESFKSDDVELAPSSNHPMVLIQIPIYNEKEVTDLKQKHNTLFRKNITLCFKTEHSVFSQVTLFFFHRYANFR